MKLVYKIGLGVLVASNLFFIAIGAYVNITKEARIKENRAYMKKVIEEEVYRQIKFVMPSSTGTVIK